jgi:hypothetical protein
MRSGASYLHKTPQLHAHGDGTNNQEVPTFTPARPEKNSGTGRRRLVRKGVRLPQALYDELVGSHRRYRYTSTGYFSNVCRKALLHYLECPDLQRAEAEAKTALEQGWADHKAKYLPS